MTKTQTALLACTPQPRGTPVAALQRAITTATDELLAALDAGRSDRLRQYLEMLARFHAYSIGNVFLILAACPTATRVAGYRTWQSLGRQVRAGARAIRILAPVVRRVAADDKDEERRVLVGFKHACVFDVGQTDGAPLPTPAEVQGDPGVYLHRLHRWAMENGIVITYAASLGGAEGASCGGQIILRRGLSPAAELSVLAHELAHEELHRATDRSQLSRTVRETEAEAVAFVVCRALGLEPGTASSDYLLMYDGHRDTLLASLERVQRTAAHILAGVLPDTHERHARGGLLDARKRPAA
jgi:hypothetical protein